MKGIIVGIFIVCLVLCSLYYVFHGTNMSLTDFTSESTKDDSVFHNVSSEDRQNQGYTKTDFTWKDSKGDEYPVYIAHTGSCFIRKTPTTRWRITIVYKSKAVKTPTPRWRIRETACFRKFE